MGIKCLLTIFNQFFSVLYDEADDETNNLVVEDEPTLQIDESWCSNDEDNESDTNQKVSQAKYEIEKTSKKKFFISIQTPSIHEENDVGNDEIAHNSSKSPEMKDIQDTRTDKDNSLSSIFSLPVSVSLSMLNDPKRFENRPTTDILSNSQAPLPAVFDKFTLPSIKVEKIDVTKYLSQHNQDNLKTEVENDDYEAMSSGIDDELTDYIVGKDRIRGPQGSLPSVVEKVTKELQNKQVPFEFFTRNIPETSHPTPESLDIKCEPSSSLKLHRSIYESSLSPLRNDESTGTTTTTRDKDMRLSSFMDDMSNGKWVCVLFLHFSNIIYSL